MGGRESRVVGVGGRERDVCGAARVYQICLEGCTCTNTHHRHDKHCSSRTADCGQRVADTSRKEGERSTHS